MSPLTQHILEGKELPNTVIIYDCVQQSGEGLLRSFISHLLTRSDRVHVIVSEGNAQSFHSDQRVTVHDASADPLGWNQSPDGSSVTLDTDFASYILAALGNTSEAQKVGLVIDNVSNVIFRRGISAVCQMLHRLAHLSHGSKVISQVVVLVHGDLHESDTLTLLDSSSSCSLKVEPPKHKDFHLSCRTLHKRTSGKVVKSNDHIRFGKNGSVILCEEIINMVKTNVQSVDASDPTANLTFNLSLTEKEKEDKNNVVLPYMKHSTKLAITKEIDSGGGKIFYQPDDADDFDEEDPDDDLDI